MANSAIVGALRVLLGLDTAEFESGVTKAKGQAAGLESEFKKFGSSFAGAFLPVASISAAGFALASFAKDAFDAAGQITDLADQTGLTTDAIQEMQEMADLTGTSLESFTNAAFKLGVNLATGTDKIREAVEALGLSYETLREQSPDEQFRAVAAALGQVEDVQERNRIGLILYGKTWKEIAAAVAQGTAEIAAGTTKVGEVQLKALDEAGDAAMAAWRDAKATAIANLGTLVLAVQKDARSLVTFADDVRHAWGAIFEGVGLKAADALPTVLKDTTAQARLLPKPLEDITMSLEDIARAEKTLDQQVKASIATNREAAKVREEVDEHTQDLTDSLIAQIDAFQRTNTIARSVHESFRLLRVDFTELIPVLQNLTTNGFEPFKAAIEQQKPVISEWAKTWEDVVSKLPNVILGAIQGGGSVLNAAGALIGTSLMEKFQKTFGPAIEAALPFGIGKAITSLLPTLGTLFGPIAKKIGDLFRNIFGGPDAEEQAGRKTVADFEAQLHALLNQTQLNEAGNEDWKKTVIAIRDAYLAAGKTEEEAMAAAKRLWESSTKGAAETAAAIKAIQDVLDRVTRDTKELDAAMDQTFRDRTVNVDVNTPELPEFAGGTMGTLGQWFGNFPQTGMAAALHGVEAVIRPDQAVPFASDVLAGLGASASATAASPTIINNHFDFDVSTLDTDELSRLIRRRVMPEINAQLSNVGELRTGMRDGLGV